ncbi:MAG TPA: hypothetical protein VGC88_12125 [Terriglobales bacterium]
MPARKKATDKNRCWPGYTPAPGKSAHEQGSCRPKAESKMGSSEKQFRAKRRKQLDKWESEHPHTRKSASQHLHAPRSHTKTNATKKKTSAKKSASTKTKPGSDGSTGASVTRKRAA